MTTLVEEVLAVVDEGMAMIDATHIVIEEQKRMSLAEDMGNPKLSPMTIMFWAMADNLANDRCDAIVIDGTQATWEMYSRKDGEVEHYPTQRLIDWPQPPEEYLKPKLGPIVQAYYLLRFYQLAGVRKYAVTRKNEGFVVAVNDPTNDRVWAAHKVE